MTIFVTSWFWKCGVRCTTIWFWFCMCGCQMHDDVILILHVWLPDARRCDFDFAYVAARCTTIIMWFWMCDCQMYDYMWFWFCMCDCQVYDDVILILLVWLPNAWRCDFDFACVTAKCMTMWFWFCICGCQMYDYNYVILNVRLSDVRLYVILILHVWLPGVRRCDFDFACVAAKCTTMWFWFFMCSCQMYDDVILILHVWLPDVHYVILILLVWLPDVHYVILILLVWLPSARRCDFDFACVTAKCMTMWFWFCLCDCQMYD